jgi:hypothetical protein
MFSRSLIRLSKRCLWSVSCKVFSRWLVLPCYVTALKRCIKVNKYSIVVQGRRKGPKTNSANFHTLLKLVVPRHYRHIGFRRPCSSNLWKLRVTEVDARWLKCGVSRTPDTSILCGQHLNFAQLWTPRSHYFGVHPENFGVMDADSALTESLTTRLE